MLSPLMFLALADQPIRESVRLDIATQAVHFTECQGPWSTSPGVCVPKKPLLLLSTYPESTKCVLLLNQTTLKNSGSSSILWCAGAHPLAWQNLLWCAGDSRTRHFAMSAGVRFYFIWILYGYRWRSLIRILWNDVR